MANINVRVVGTANVTQMSAKFAQLQEQVAGLNAQMREVVATSKAVDPSGYERMQRAAATGAKTFRNAAASTGMFEVQQLRLNSATDDYVKKLNAQKLSFRDMIAQQKIAKKAYQEQLAMQNMVVRQNEGANMRGRNLLDTFVPRGVSSEIDDVGKRLAFMNAQLKSGAQQLVNWGKNTQWAGRQLMVGFTMPVAAFGAAAGVMAYKVDQEFTRVKKVYDTTADQTSNRMQDMMAVQSEFAQLQQQSYATATTAAGEYGTKMQDTMSVMADLAATGQKGAALQKAATEVVKNAMLGEIDYQTTTKATIALQQILHMNTKQLADTWAYMNSVENATSLSMADFAQAIPIAMGPLKQMGGTVQDLGTLLTGMVSRGIAVGKAANAIKAAAQRLIRPSKQVQEEFAKLTGYDIVKIGKANKGNLLGMLQDIYQVTQKLDKYHRTKVLAGLFGSYQLSTMSAMVDGMGDLANGVGQVTKAQEIGKQSAKQWGDVQRQEIGQFQQSISGQFKRAVALLQTQMVSVGKPFIQVATVVIKAITQIMKAFNGLPNWAKWGLAGAAAFAALAGPVVMLAGLFANLVGNVMKMTGSFAGLFLKMEILDKETRAGKMAAELASSGFMSEKSAADELNMSLQALIASMKEEQMMARNTRVDTLTASGMSRAAAINQLANERRAAGLAVEPDASNRVFVAGSTGTTAITKEQAATNAAAMEKEAVASAKVSKNMKIAGGASAVMGAAMVTQMVPGTNATADNIANMVMMAAVLGPSLSTLPTLFRGAGKGMGSILGGMKGATMGALDLVKVFGRFAFTTPAGLIGIAIGGLYLINKLANKNAEDLKKMNDTASTWGGIFGYQATSRQQAVNPKTGQTMDTLASRVVQLKKDAPEVGDAIRKAMNEAGDGMSKAAAEAKALDIAIRQGLQVRNSGGSAQQARQAVKASLSAGIDNINTVNRLMKTVDLQVNFKVNKSVAKQSIDQAMKELQVMVDDSAPKGFFEKMQFWNIGEASHESQDSAKEAANTFWDSFKSQSTQDQKKMANDLLAGMQKQSDDILKTFVQNRPKVQAVMEKYGIQTGEDLSQAMLKGRISNKDMQTAGLDLRNPAYNQFQKSITQWEIAREQFAKQLAENRGMNYDDWSGLDKLFQRMIGHYKTLINAQKEYNADIAANANLVKARKSAEQSTNALVKVGVGALLNGTKKYTKEQQLQMLNNKRVANGLQKTGNLADHFGAVTKKWTPNMDKADKKAKDINGELAKMKDKNVTVNIRQQFSGGDYKTILQNSMQGVQQSMSDTISANFDKRMQSALDSRQKMWDNRTAAQSARFEQQSNAMDARFEREQNALDAHWAHRKDAAQKYFDNLTKNVQKEIDAEQKADDKRQKMFEAEIARINALNDAANQNIDFNVALNTGKLDEAAKIRNDVTAKDAQTALENAATAGSASSQARIDRLQKRQDKIQSRADAYMKKLDKQEAAAQAALKKREDAEKAHLAKMQKMREAALKKEADADMKAQQAEWDARKKNLDQQLDLFMSYIAKNKKDLDKHIKDVGLAYAVFGKDKLMPMGTKWSQWFGTELQKNIHKAGLAVASDNMWKAMGSGAAKQVLDAFGFSDMAAFKAFIKTGNMPTGKDKKGVGSIAHSPGMTRAGNDGHKTRHAGGWIGGGKDNRAGIPKRAPLKRNESMVLARDDEFMVNPKASAENASLLEMMNRGEKIGSNDVGSGRGPSGGAGTTPVGVVGMVSAIMTKMLAEGIMNSMTNVGSKRMSEYQARMAKMVGAFGTAKAGMYGQRMFNATQLHNAATIARVGKQMKMSARDIEIGIMTAITESGLINIHGGDRDSQGLFQQRPSMGWGTVAQVTNPEYAAHKFFSVLKGVSDRANMSPWMAAQSVQRSAYPDGSNYRQYWDEAEAIFKAMGKAQGSTATGVYVPGKGGRHRPINKPVTRGLHDVDTGFPAVDFATPIGTPVYAVADGTVIRSEAITGGGSPGNGTRAPNGQAYTSYGEVIYLHTNGGPTVLYAHLSKRGVNKGSHVRGGSIIGRSGNTGNSTGPHLHFGSQGVSPYAWLKDGGHTLNQGFAMLHPEETVLTKPLSHDLQSVVSLLGNTARGISGGNANVASGTTNHYYLKVDATGADVDTDELVDKVITGIKKLERRKPRSRRG